MIRGLYIAASSAISEAKRIDVIANNIANVNTAGYKKDVMTTENFPEILISKINGFPDKDILRQRSAGNGFSLENDGELYNASAGAGYFNVQTPAGISRSKSISFKVDENGYLVTPKGYYVLGRNGPIYVGDAQLSVDNTGQVLADGNAVDSFRVSNPINAIGQLSYGIRTDQISINFEQGQLESTGNSFDLALRGKGFFCIETPEGERYTRDGQFTRDAQGYLVTTEGYKVLGENGEILLEGKDMTVNENGEVFSGSDMVDRLRLVDFSDYKALRKEGDGLIKVEDGLIPEMQEAPVQIQQGFLEGSNVNSVKEMVDMLTMLRSYEASQKVIKIHDELIGKSVNEIARV